MTAEKTEAAVRRNFFRYVRSRRYTSRPCYVPSTAASAEEESLEPTAHPSSLRGIADVRVTIDVAALRTALSDPRQLSAAESWLLVSTARPQLGLSSDCVRQDLSPGSFPSRNASLGRAQPCSATENCTGRRQRQDALSAKGCVNPLRKARRCRRGFIGNRVAGSVLAPDPESLRNRGQKARSTRGTRRRSSSPFRTAASRGSPPV